ncbi:MAG: PDZ domain-containing protein [Halanaerobiaceae bacterium]|nr:PDZ domain-containing protein [Halanaerobiaceae bacterium]
MSRRNGIVTSIAGILFISIIFSFFLPTPYMIMAPGIAQELSSIITVEDGYKNEIKGELMLTAVSTQRATILDYLYIKFNKPVGIELDHISEHLPEGMNMVEYLELMDEFMQDSQNKAIAVAFLKAGLPVSIEDNGVMIAEVLKNSAAVGKLQRGDLIIAVDGKKVGRDKEAVELIRQREIGDSVTITVNRDGEVLDFSMKTVPLDVDDESYPSIGVTIYSNIDYSFPREVHFHTENIGGSSAGGMFALEIYNQLVKEDITRGRRIAGTGTIDLDGKIGPIDGVEQKVIAAERKGAELFLVPVENYEKALQAASSIKVVAVESFDEALEYLLQN